MKKYYIILFLFPIIIFALNGCITNMVGGAFKHEPDEFKKSASKGALRLVKQSYEGINPDELADYHVHLVGIGTSGSGTSVNPNMQSWLHRINRVKFGV